MLKLLPYIPKRDLSKTNKTLEQEFVWQTYNLPCGLTDILFHIKSGRPVGVEVKDKFKILPSTKSMDHYTLYNLSDLSEKIYIFFDNYELLQTLEPHSYKRITIPINASNVKILIKDINLSINLDIIKLCDFNYQNFTSKLAKSFEINCNTGVLHILDDDTKIREIWPSLVSPYLTAGIIPNRFSTQSYHQINKNKFVILEQKETIIIKRDYLYEENCMSISTSYKLLTNQKIDPFYQFVLDDLNYLCEFWLEGELLDSFKYNPKDRTSYTEEVMFENFKHYNSNINDVDVIVRYDNSNYHIKFPMNTKIFLNCNCIIARQSVDNNYINNKSDFISLGKITINKYKEEVNNDST